MAAGEPVGGREADAEDARVDARVDAHVDAHLTLTVFGVAVTLAPIPGVFMPTPHGRFYAGAARVGPGERVADVGTGSGVLAVAAARAGAAHVVATDVDPRAVAATRANAARNGVAPGVLDARVGPLFAGAAGPFDVILANLPNEIVAPAHLATLPPDAARAFAGGAAGNEALLALLEAAPAHMHARTRLYLGVHALTDYHATLHAALARYAVRLVAFAPLPVKAYVAAHLDFYQSLDAAGVVRLFRDDVGRWSSWGYVYELTLPHREEAPPPPRSLLHPRRVPNDLPHARPGPSPDAAHRARHRATYDRVADEYVRRFAGELAHKPFDRARLDAFASRVRGVGRVADLGCGPGHVAAYLRARGADVEGVDLSPALVARARALHPDIPFREGDLAALDVPDGAWAGAVAFYSLIHVPRADLPGALAELRRVLRPSAPLLVAFHAGREVRHLDEWWGHAVDVDFTFYEPAEMADALGAAGFTVEAVEERDPYPDVEAATRRAYVTARAR